MPKTVFVFSGERLRSMRCRRRWDVENLAYLASVSARHIYRLESGDCPDPKASVIGRLAGALDRSPDMLFSREKVVDPDTDYEEEENDTQT